MLSWFSEPPTPPAPLTLRLEVDEERVFTAFERITGRLLLTPRADTAFDDLTIKLSGTSRTYGRRVVPQAPNARTVTTAHRFLELTQPGLVFDFPTDRVFRNGRTYEFPFQFAVPDRMLPSTCRHPVRSPRVHHIHTSMPPSFGDQDHGRAVDYSPRNVSVTYSIVGEVTRLGSPDECPSSSLIASASKRIRFIPTQAPPTLPPVSWTEVFSFRNEVALKKFWTRPAGKLAITSVKCTTFSVREPQSELWNSHISGQVRVKLAFFPDCNNNIKPPGHIKVNGILRSETISAVRPIPQLPSDQAWDGPELDRHAAPAVIMSSKAIDRIIWSQHSKYGTISSDDALPCYDTLLPRNPTNTLRHRSYHSTEIVISLGAAIGFSLVPSFDSCLVSRNYSVELKLSMHSSAISSSAVRFTIPVRVAVEQSISRKNSPVLAGELEEDLSRRGSIDFDLPPCYECRI